MAKGESLVHLYSYHSAVTSERMTIQVADFTFTLYKLFIPKLDEEKEVQDPTYRTALSVKVAEVQVLSNCLLFVCGSDILITRS